MDDQYLSMRYHLGYWYLGINDHQRDFYHCNNIGAGPLESYFTIFPSSPRSVGSTTYCIMTMNHGPFSMD